VIYILGEERAREGYTLFIAQNTTNINTGNTRAREGYTLFIAQNTTNINTGNTRTPGARKNELIRDC
jgi:hypothetical protein